MLLAGCGLEPQEVSKDVEAQQLSKDDELFMKGYFTGLVETHESQIVNAYSGLRLLKDINVDEIKTYRRMLISNMNTALFSLWFVAHEVTIRPEILKITTEIKSDNFRGFFEKLKELRNQNNWLYDELEKEEKVQWVLDQYIQYGNVLGFQNL